MGTTKNELSPRDVINYANDNLTVFLTMPVHNGQVQYQIKHASYKDKTYYFLTSDGVYEVEDKGIENKPFEMNRRIYIHATYGTWSLYKGFDLTIYDDCMYKNLEPHEIKECIRQAKEIEAFINANIDFKDNSPVKAFARFKVRVNFDDYGLEDLAPHPDYFFYFEIRLSNTNGTAIYADDVPILLNMTDKEALNHLLHTLRDELPNLVAVCDKT